MEKLSFLKTLQDLDDEYYECCRDLLTEWFIPFKYVKEQDIRKEDIAERLYWNTIFHDKEKKEAEKFKDYARNLENLFNYFFKTVNNSRAELYQRRGEEICKSILTKHEYTIDNFLDITKIFICFSREVFSERNKSAKLSPILNINFEVEPSDIRLIKSFRNRELRYEIPQLVGKKKEKIIGEAVYGFASIFLCHLLQNEGVGINKIGTNGEGESSNV